MGVSNTHFGELQFEYSTFHLDRFDFTKANLNDPNLDKMEPSDIPDVVSLLFGNTIILYCLHNLQYL